MLLCTVMHADERVVRPQHAHHERSASVSSEVTTQHTGHEAGMPEA